MCKKASQATQDVDGISISVFVFFGGGWYTCRISVLFWHVTRFCVRKSAPGTVRSCGVSFVFLLELLLTTIDHYLYCICCYCRIVLYRTSLASRNRSAWLSVHGIIVTCKQLFYKGAPDARV